MQSNTFRTVIFCGLLLVVVVATYWPAGQFAYTNYQDPEYVSKNERVQSGLTFDNLRWAFVTFHAGTWHPFAWMSHMLDCELFGINPGAHHRINVLWHALNALLLFLLWKRMTRTFWPAAIISALFGLHPLNVEPVAWIAQRQQVLGASFWVLSIAAYLYYSRRPGGGRYALLLLLYILCLGSNPVLISLPLVLLLLDYWPLRRSLNTPLNTPLPADANTEFPARSTRALLLEKLPLAILSVTAVTIFINASPAAAFPGVGSAKGSSLGHALVSCIIYVGKTVCPDNLAVLYPDPGVVPGWQIVGSLVLLFFVTAFALLFWRTRPYLIVGWLWYLAVLIPALLWGGIEELADRHVYLANIGLFIMVVFGVAEWAVLRTTNRRVVAATTFLVLVAATLITSRQLVHWRDSITLFTHAVAVTTGNAEAHYRLGEALTALGKLEEPMQQYQEAIRLRPAYAAAHNNLALSLVLSGDALQASNHYAQALAAEPANDLILANYGATLLQLGHRDEARRALRRALSGNPANSEAHERLGDLLLREGQAAEALQHFDVALRQEPDNSDTRYFRAKALLALGRPVEAVEEYKRVLRVNPSAAEVHFELGSIYVAQKNTDEAITHFERAVTLKPNFIPVLNNYAWLLATHPEERVRNGKRAVTLAQAAVRASNNRQPVFIGTLAAAYAEAGQFSEAVSAGMQAEQLARQLGQNEVAARNAELLKLYQAGMPFHEAP